MSKKSQTSENTITLGGRSFVVPPFNIDQLEPLVPHFLNIDQKLSEGGYRACRDVVKAALEIHGLIEPEELAALKVGAIEVRDAAVTIGKICGMIVTAAGEHPGGKAGTD